MRKTIVAIQLAIKSLRSNVGRTVLSLLGIVIGVMAVVIVLSLGAGLQSYVMSELESFGTDYIQLEVKTPNTEHASSENAGAMAGGAQITTMKIEDAEEIAKLSNIKAWYAGNLGQEVVGYKGKNEQTMIFGATAGVKDVDASYVIEEGESFTEEDDRNLKRVAVLGSEVKKTFFGSENAVGKKMKIKNQNYKVLGVVEERGGGGPFSFDEMIYVPSGTFHKRIAGIDYISFAMFKVDDVSRMELTKLEMVDVMRDQHDIDNPDEDDFGVMSVAEATDLLDDVFAVINILLLALTSISLVVGGVGITNVMYVSVTERTFEIGLRKSVGARGVHILQQFMFEAIFITLAGGIFGILLGVGVSKLAEYVIAQMGFVLSFPLSLNAVVTGLVFSAVTGLIFGIRPAIKASKLSPMEALRKE